MRNIDDNDFIKGDYPFSKEEIRSIILKKLRLESNSRLISLGGDTLFTCIEASGFIKEKDIVIYESNNDFSEILNKNLEKFSINNIIMSEDIFFSKDNIEFDRILVGNGIGRIPELIDFFIKKSNKGDIIVFKEITLEKVTEVNKLLHNRGVEKVEVTCVNLSKNQNLLGLNMMVAENPVFIIKGIK